MTLAEIKAAVDAGRRVYWQSKTYTVKHDGHRYIIKHDSGSCIALTWVDGVTLNGNPDEFFAE